MQDLTKSAEDILTDVINVSNSASPTYVPYAYGALQFKDVETLPEGSSHNSTIKVSDMDAANASDWMNIYYDRVPLSRPLSRVEPTLRYADGSFSTTHDMLEALNERFRINLTEDDIIDEGIDFDPEGGEFPFTLALRAAPTSKIYYGAASIELIDPNAGIGIIGPVTTDFDALPPEFSNEGEMGGVAGYPATGFAYSTNDEIFVGGSIAKANGDQLPEEDIAGGGNAYTFELQLDNGENWVFLSSFGLLNTANGEHVAELYDLRVIIEAHGLSRFDMTLFKEGNNYIFRSQDRALSIANSAIGPDGLYINNAFKLSDFPDAITEESKNGAGAALGTYRMIMIATRKEGDVAPVTVEITTVTNVVANVSATLVTPANTIQLVDGKVGDYEVPFIFQVAVTGPAGVPLVLEDDIDLTLLMGGIVSFRPNPATNHGIVLNDDGTGVIPAGLAKGIYEVEGVFCVPESYMITPEESAEGSDIGFDLSFEDLQGNTVELAAIWNVLSPIPVDGTPPALIAPPELNGTLYSGGMFNIEPGQYGGDEPLTVVRSLLEYADDGEVTLLYTHPLDEAELEISIVGEMIGHYFKIREVVTNAAGSLTSYSSLSDVIGSAPTFIVMLTPPRILAMENGEVTEWEQATFNVDPEWCNHTLYRISHSEPASSVAMASLDGEDAISNYEFDGNGSYFVIAVEAGYTDADEVSSNVDGQSEVFEIGEGEIGFARDHLNVDIVPHVRRGVIGEPVYVYPGSVSGVGLPYLANMEWVASGQTSETRWNNGNRPSFDDIWDASQPTTQPGSIDAVVEYRVWAGWESIYLKTASYELLDEEPTLPVTLETEVELEGFTPHGLYPDFFKNPVLDYGDWDGVAIAGYDAVIYGVAVSTDAGPSEYDPEAMLNGHDMSHVNLFFNGDRPYGSGGTENYVYRAQVWAIDEDGVHHGPFWSTSYLVEGEAVPLPSFNPFNIVWDPIAKVFVPDNLSLTGSWLSPNGEEVYSGTEMGVELIGQWSINGTTIYRDGYGMSEASDNGLTFIGAPTVADIPLLGANLVLKVSARILVGSVEDPGSQEHVIINGTSATFTVDELYWGSSVRPIINDITIPVSPTEGELLTADFTPAVFDNFESGMSVSTMWKNVNFDAGGTGHSYTNDEPAWYDGETIYQVVQELRDGSGNSLEFAYSLPFYDGDTIGPNVPVTVCVGRPKILRAVVGEVPIVFPGTWSAGLTAEFRKVYPVDALLYKVADDYAPSTSDLFSTSNWIHESSSVVAGDKVVTWIGARNTTLPLNEFDQQAVVMTAPVTLLSEVEGETMSLPTLDAPSLTSVDGMNKYTFTHAPEIGGLLADTIAAQWSIKRESNPWEPAGYTIGIGSDFTSDDMIGMLELFDPENVDTGQVYKVRVATVVKLTNGSFAFSDWSEEFEFVGP